MNMTDDPRIEAAAKALWERDYPGEREWEGTGWPVKWYYEQARAALAAADEAEPTTASTAKLRNLAVILRSHFAQPENWHDDAWTTHLEEVAKLMHTVSRIGGRSQPTDEGLITDPRVEAAAKGHAPRLLTKVGRAWINDEGSTFPVENLHRYECSCGWKGRGWYAVRLRAWTHFDRHLPSTQIVASLSSIRDPD